jgi:transcriptional regulator with PAS, ATPase and Fis domain
MNIQEIKQRFGIIGNHLGLNRAIDIARQVAPTDLSVLITGESGTGKENFPNIIHHLSVRKHGDYIAVNCGAIPEGTIDSELFGHEKGAFTGAVDKRLGYFEVANNGTIFLDEVGELPLSTQVRLLRILETGEFMKVGSSKVQKTNVRVIAATNLNIPEAIAHGKFREDLYYRLNTVPIIVPPLRERKEDINLLFRKFAQDFAEKYRMPSIRLDAEAQYLMENYSWPGNIRQLKNVTEQLSVIERERTITSAILRHYLPAEHNSNLPAIYKGIDEKTFSSEREILYQILFDMKKDMNDLKKLVYEITSKGPDNVKFNEKHADFLNKIYEDVEAEEPPQPVHNFSLSKREEPVYHDATEIVEEPLSLQTKELELIKKALERHKGKRKAAADELGISERTLYRKLKEYELE